MKKDSEMRISAQHSFLKNPGAILFVEISKSALPHTHLHTFTAYF